MITILAVGQKQPDWVKTGFDEYASRFPPDYEVMLREIKAEPRSIAKSIDAMKALEAERIRTSLPKGSINIALDERGKIFTTREFGAFLSELRNESRDATFIIGGPDGLDDSLKQACQHQIRLSSMTLPHGLARVLLVEQIYRAWSLITNHPYHRS